jgi:hypothetical protein
MKQSLRLAVAGVATLSLGLTGCGGDLPQAPRATMLRTFHGQSVPGSDGHTEAVSVP